MVFVGSWLNFEEIDATSRLARSGASNELVLKLMKLSFAIDSFSFKLECHV